MRPILVDVWEGHPGEDFDSFDNFSIESNGGVARVFDIFDMDLVDVWEGRQPNLFGPLVRQFLPNAYRRTMILLHLEEMLYGYFGHDVSLEVCLHQGAKSRLFVLDLLWMYWPPGGEY